jgi:hypothetical protein
MLALVSPACCVTQAVCYHMWCMRRDRASKNTENAIQSAHEDNHSAKAMEVVLCHARDKGVAFCPDLPLVPTLQEVKEYMSRATRDGVHVPAAGGVAHPGRGRGKFTDSPECGERTFFMGKGQALGVASHDGVAARNAVGFFMYTHCAKNPRGEWPHVLG